MTEPRDPYPDDLDTTLRIRHQADELFRRAYALNPQRASRADHMASDVVIQTFPGVLPGEDQRARGDSIAALRKIAFMFMSDQIIDGEITQRDLATVAVDRISDSADLHETAERLDTHAAYLFAYRSLAEEQAGSMWSAMTPSQRLWYTEGTMAVRADLDFHDLEA